MMPNACEEPEPTTAGSPITLFLDASAERAGPAAFVDVDRATLTVPSEGDGHTTIVGNVVRERTVEARAEYEESLPEADRMVPSGVPV
jgi:hypothetical protein